MHILIVSNNLLSGGAERVIVQLLDQWVNNGIKCSLILLKKTQHFYSLPKEVSLYEIGASAKTGFLSKFNTYSQVRKIAKLADPDIVLSMPEEIGIYTIGALLGTGIPVVVSERNNPWIMPNKKITRMCRFLLYPFASGLIFQTKQAASFFSVRLQKKGIVLSNPLDLSRIPQPYTGVRKKIIVGVGRLEKQKNFKLLINAFAEFYKTHREYKLVIYGEGSLRFELESYASAVLPDSSFEFPGVIVDLLDQIKDASAFVLSSDYEGIPNVLIEAMATGIPSVSVDCAPGGASELIEDGVNGFLVPVGDCEALAKKLCMLIDDVECSERFSRKSIAIQEQLESKKICAEWLNYLRLVANNERLK